MTKQQALNEAVRRWGQRAAVKQSKCYLTDEVMWNRKPPRLGPLRAICSCEDHEKPCPGDKKACAVGTVVMGLFFSVRGEASTWEKAFAIADQNPGRL